jgi:coenzyme F420-reducing hydrogenase delta subunit
MNGKTVKIYVFCCTTSYDQAQLMQKFSQQETAVNVVSLPCSGKLDILYLIKAFETGADGVAVMICKEGECRYLEGNMRARKRSEAVTELLKETGLSGDRLAVIQMENSGIEPAQKKLEEFCLRVAALNEKKPTGALPT